MCVSRDNYKKVMTRGKILQTVRIYTRLECVNHSGMFHETEKISERKPPVLIAWTLRSVTVRARNMSEKIRVSCFPATWGLEHTTTEFFTRGCLVG